MYASIVVQQYRAYKHRVQSKFPPASARLCRVRLGALKSDCLLVSIRIDAIKLPSLLNDVADNFGFLDTPAGTIGANIYRLGG